jgi:hypothetical protein
MQICWAEAADGFKAINKASASIEAPRMRVNAAPGFAPLVVAVFMVYSFPFPAAGGARPAVPL